MRPESYAFTPGHCHLRDGSLRYADKDYRYNPKPVSLELVRLSKQYWWWAQSR